MRRILLAALLVTAPAFSQPIRQPSRLTPEQQEIQKAHDNYHECTVDAALKLEKSGESAGDLASAAVTLCKQAMIEVMAVGAVNGQNYSLDQLDRIDSNARAAALVAVVQARAARHR